VFDILRALATASASAIINGNWKDLSLRYLGRVQYKQIAKLLMKRRLDRRNYRRRHETVAAMSWKRGIQPRSAGRAKHIYSHLRKMRRKGIDFSS